MRKTVKRLMCAALAALLCCAVPCAAHADSGDGSESLIDPQQPQSIVDGLLSAHSVNGSDVSVGYCYLATGDTWYYNEDTWMYAASVYKVPLMMLMAEKVYNGELTQQSVISGITLEEEESLILTYSNNDYARDLRFNYFGGDAAWGELAQKFSDMAVEDYDPNYIEYRYYNPRYIVDVLKTLYTDSERFPNVIDCLLQAEPGGYFRSTLEGQYSIAQKYGAYEENDGTNNNHAVGIIYTPNPIIVSVMTRNVANYESFIGDAAQELAAYTLSLDSELEAYEQQALQQAEDEARQAQLQADEDAQRLADEAAQRLAQEQAEQETARHRADVKKWALIGGAALVLLIAVTAVLIPLKRRSRRRSARRGAELAEKQRRYEARETRSTRENSGGYTPRH